MQNINIGVTNSRGTDADQRFFFTRCRSFHVRHNRLVQFWKDDGFHNDSKLD